MLDVKKELFIKDFDELVNAKIAVEEQAKLQVACLSCSETLKEQIMIELVKEFACDLDKKMEFFKKYLVEMEEEKVEQPKESEGL